MRFVGYDCWLNCKQSEKPAVWIFRAWVGDDLHLEPQHQVSDRCTSPRAFGIFQKENECLLKSQGKVPSFFNMQGCLFHTSSTKRKKKNEKIGKNRVILACIIRLIDKWEALPGVESCSKKRQSSSSWEFCGCAAFMPSFILISSLPFTCMVSAHSLPTPGGAGWCQHPGSQGETVWVGIPQEWWGTWEKARWSSVLLKLNSKDQAGKVSHGSPGPR